MNTRSTMKKSASRVEDEANSLSAEGPVISVSCSSTGVRKVRPSPMASKASLAPPDGFLVASAMRLGVEIELGPLRARDRPFVFGAGDEFLARVADLQQHLRLLRPAVLLAVQEIVEEAQLLLAAVVGVEMRPVLDAVRLQPFLLGRGAHEAFEIAARMQALAAPIGGGEQRRRHLVPDRRAVAVIFVVQRMLAGYCRRNRSGSWRALLRTASPGRTPVRRARGCGRLSRRGRIARP